MVQKLKAIKGGGGSIKLGTTGTISALMSRELESMKSASPMLDLSRNKPPMVSVSIPPEATTVRRLKTRTLVDEASTSRNSNVGNHKRSDKVRKTKHYNRKSHQIPMLSSDNISLDGTPIRQKSDKKGPNIVEIVDVRCGNPNRTWVSPITNRLKKLGFSKLSESII